MKISVSRELEVSDVTAQALRRDTAKMLGRVEFRDEALRVTRNGKHIAWLIPAGAFERTEA